MIRLPQKAPAEEIVVTFRYARELPAGVTLAANPVVTAAARKGADPDAPAILPDPPAVAGSDVLVRVVGGLDQVQYHLSCLAPTSDGQRLQLDALLLVALPR